MVSISPFVEILKGADLALGGIACSISSILTGPIPSNLTDYMSQFLFKRGKLGLRWFRFVDLPTAETIMRTSNKKRLKSSAIDGIKILQNGKHPKLPPGR